MQGDFHVEGYDIEGLLGAGPAGEVWLARDQSTRVQVALKRVRPRDADAHDEARRIVSLLETIAHPNLLAVKELLPVGDELVFVLDYAEGGSLGQLLLARTTLDPGEVVTMATAVAEALAAVHEQGLVHGDVTPDNVLFTADARPLLADVGFLRLVEGGESGTLGFSDPATAGGDRSPAADVFSLGAVCYAALTGAPPEPGRTHRPVHQVAPGVPPGLAHLIEAGLSARPDARPGAGQFASQLSAACAPVPVRFPDGLSSSPARASHDHAGPRPDGPAFPSADATATDRAESPGPPPFRSPPDSVSPPEFSNRPPAFPTSADGPPATDTRSPMDEDDEDESGARRPTRILLLAGAGVAAVAVAGLGVVGWRAVAGGPTPHDTSTPAASAGETPATTHTPTPKPAGKRPAPSSSPRTAAEAHWTKVLNTLDQRRAEAWRTWDRTLLNRVYTPGSQALAEEISRMKLYASRNVTSVADLNTPILSLDVVSERKDRVVVDAVSQLQPYSVEMGGRYYPHDGGEPKRFRMTLRPDGSGGWLIGSSTEVGPAR